MRNAFVIRGVARAALAVLTVASSALAQSRPPVDPRLYAGLTWRNLGPFRGGRIAAVSGAIGPAGTFYIGLPAAGVWKTTSAGETWFPVFDAIKDVSSIGSVEVAPSDPNIVYVGTGDIVTGGGDQRGQRRLQVDRRRAHLAAHRPRRDQADPVDDGRSARSEYRDARRAGRHPREEPRPRRLPQHRRRRDVDANAVRQRQHRSAEDRARVRHAERGLRDDRSALHAAGAADAPGGARRGARRNARPDRRTRSCSSRSTVASRGRRSPAVDCRRASRAKHGSRSPTTRAQRVFVIGDWGLYRSDDGGTTWRQMAAEDQRIRNGQGGYNCGVYVDPQNPDVVYTLNTASYKSTDGGKTFTGFKGAPGGDDPQQMWIDPTNGQRILFGYDQGAIVSLDGGGTWSSWYNQSTEQIYHLSVDNSFPYWVYGTQQDAGAIRTRIRGNLGAITPLDWNPVSGWEWGTIVPDPLDPNTVYSSGSGILKISYPSEQWINVSPARIRRSSCARRSSQPIALRAVESAYAASPASSRSGRRSTAACTGRR